MIKRAPSVNTKMPSNKAALGHGVIGSAFSLFEGVHKIMMCLTVVGGFDLMKYGVIYLF